MFCGKLGPGVRRFVDREQALGVDRGVALRRRQAGVAQQFLDRPQIAAAAQKMRREAVAQRVRGGGLRQAERAAQHRHLALHQARRERPAAGADKERAVGRQRIGAGGEVIGDRLPHRRQVPARSRCLLPLPVIVDLLALRRLGARQAERLGNAQAAAVEQGQHGDVALGLPGAGDEAVGRLDQFGGVGHRQRLRHALRQFRRAQHRQGRARRQAAPVEKRMKPRTTDSPRAAELRSTSAAREASQAR